MTKERLRTYQAIKRELEQLREQLEELEAAIYNPSVSKMSNEPKGSGGISDPTGNGATKHQELVDRYRAKMAELIAEQLEIEDAIESLDGTARALMRYRYIEGLTWEEVCVKISYSWMQTHRIHAKALEQLRRQEEKAKDASVSLIDGHIEG